MWLAFSIALLGYGSGLVASDLWNACKKTKDVFWGQLEQNFIVFYGFGYEVNQEPGSKNPRNRTSLDKSWVAWEAWFSLNCKWH
jgi:hypothetical protein